MLCNHFCHQGASRMRGRLGSMGSIGSFERVSVLEGWRADTAKAFFLSMQRSISHWRSSVPLLHCKIWNKWVMRLKKHTTHNSNIQTVCSLKKRSKVKIKTGIIFPLQYNNYNKVLLKIIYLYHQSRANMNYSLFPLSHLHLVWCTVIVDFPGTHHAVVITQGNLYHW